MTKHRVGVRK